MQIFGERLRDLRQERNLSLMQLAKLTQISNATLCRWENNTVDVKGAELVILAKFFGVSTDYLLGLEDWNKKDTHLGVFFVKVIIKKTYKT